MASNNFFVVILFLNAQIFICNERELRSLNVLKHKGHTRATFTSVEESSQLVLGLKNDDSIEGCCELLFLSGCCLYFSPL